MKKILMVCSMGMSTSFFTKKMNQVAKDNGINIEVYARSENAIEEELDKVDGILIAPQIACQEEQIRKRVGGKVPVECVDSLMFGKMNAVGIIKQTLHMFKAAEK